MKVGAKSSYSEQGTFLLTALEDFIQGLTRPSKSYHVCMHARWTVEVARQAMFMI